MIASRLRVILAIELVAYYFAAPYIILLGLDEQRGLFDAATPMNYRLLAYALLVGIYPFLLMLVSPYVGKQLDQRQSKISILRKIHLANGICYSLLGVAAWFHSLPLALFALVIPGVVGCASPVGKSLIASLTKPEERVQEFAKLAFIKGVVKLSIPLAGVFVFKILLQEAGYSPLFYLSSLLSFGCFLYSFTFPHYCEKQDVVAQTPAWPLFTTLVKNNYPLLAVFMLLITGYAVFVKFAPFMLFEKIGDNPSIVNYFASLVGLAASVNQLTMVRYADRIGRVLGLVFISLLVLTMTLCVSGAGPIWFVGFFGVLFCFSVLHTSIEARLSLAGAVNTQGTRQGILYSVENWGYIVAPALGSVLASFSTVYPLYFVASVGFFALLFFIYSDLRPQRAYYTEAG